MLESYLTRVAVTGGLSSGKSAVCQYFKECGAYVVSADEIVHQLLTPDTHIGQQVINLIGSQIVINNQIDRSEIAKKVFNQPKLLKALEEILHPAVYTEICKQMENAKKQNAPLFVAEVPLLYETNAQRFFDWTVFVKADPNLCKKRFCEKTGHSPEEYEKRMTRQLESKEKEKKADFIIENNGSLSEMKKAVCFLYTSLTRNL